MKPITTLLLLFTLCVILSSCNKDGSIIHPKKYSNIFNRVAIIKVQDKLYSNHTEITDTALKSRFMKSANTYFNLDKTPMEANYRLIFFKRDSVTFSAGVNPYGFKLTGNQYIFSSRQDAAVTFTIDSLYLNIFKYNSSTFTPFMQGTHPSYRYTDIRTGYGDSTEIKLPFISYKLSTRSSKGYTIYTGLRPNDFDASIIGKLGPQDTLAIQVFNYDMKADLAQ